MAFKYPPPSPPYIPASKKGRAKSNRPKALVIHGTVSSDNKGTARQIALWWNGPKSPMSSCHYIVDPTETIQCVYDTTIAYHCGANADTIGIELCDEQTGPASRWQDADSQAIIRRAARLAAELCLAYGIEARRPSVEELKRKGKHGIYGHNDSRLAFGGTTHTDPRDFPWDQFMSLVRAEIAKIKASKGGLAKPAPTAKRPIPENLPPFYHTSDYVRHNSATGLREGREKGFKSIDLDANMTQDGVWAIIHWPDLRGFRQPDGDPARGPISKRDWDYVSSLKSNYGPVRSAWDMLNRAKKAGYQVVELDVKDIPTLEHFEDLKKAADQIGIRVVVKRLSSLPGWRRTLKRAHQAGLETMLLPRGTVKASKAAWSYVDMVRQGGENKVIWV